MRVPAACLALSLIAGACLGLQTGPDPLLRAALVLAVVVLVWTRRRSPAALVGSVAAVFACGGALLAGQARDAALEPPLRRVLAAEFGGFHLDTLGPEGAHPPLLVRALLLEDAAARPPGAQMRLRVLAVHLRERWVPAGGGVIVSVAGHVQPPVLATWRAGRTIEAPLTFRRPASYLNPGVPDVERQLALGGTTLFGSLKSGLLVTLAAPGSWRQERAADVRASVRGAVARWVAPHSDLSAAIVAAILIGDRSALPDEVRERLQDAGVYHVLAISGGNIAILVGAVLFASRVGGLAGRAGTVLTLAVLLTYAQVVVAGASVFRAVVMAATYLVARALDHRIPPWQAVTLAAAITVALDPLDLLDAGFLLTFAATGALLGVVSLADRLRPLPALIRWPLGGVLASAATELVLLPIGAAQFGRVTFVGLIANLVAIPLMTAAQVGGMALALGFVSESAAAASGWVAHLGAAGLVESARFADLLPWLVTRVPAPAWPAVGAYYLTGLLAIRLRRQWRALLAGVTAALGLLITTGPLPALPGAPGPALEVTMFDVGQGEAIHLGWRHGGSMLIDAGGSPFGTTSFDIGDRVVRPALWAAGVRVVDDVLVTHGDPDHIGGAAAILASFAPRRLLEGIVVPGHGPFDELRRDAAGRGMVVRPLVAGDAWRDGEASVRVLWPERPDWERRRVRNDDSVVLEVTYGDVAVLLTGDISAAVEEQLAKNGVGGHLKRTPAIRVLKVAHHGSRTSTSQALIDAWRPQIALISCGRGNRFGHPAPEVLDRLHRAGARIYRTDHHGAITLTTDGRAVRVTTMRP